MLYKANMKRTFYMTSMLRLLPLMPLILCLFACSFAQQSHAQDDDASLPPLTFKKVYIGDQLIITVPEDWVCKDAETYLTQQGRVVISKYGGEYDHMQVSLISPLDKYLNALLYMSNEQFEVEIVQDVYTKFKNNTEKNKELLTPYIFPIEVTTIAGYKAMIIRTSLSMPLVKTNEFQQYDVTLAYAVINPVIALEFVINTLYIGDIVLMKETSEMIPGAHLEMLDGISIAKGFKNPLD